jgi:hypothetical protein
VSSKVSGNLEWSLVQFEARLVSGHAFRHTTKSK